MAWDLGSGAVIPFLRQRSVPGWNPLAALVSGKLFRRASGREGQFDVAGRYPSHDGWMDEPCGIRGWVPEPELDYTTYVPWLCTGHIVHTPLVVRQVVGNA